jgi:serpin B
MKKTLLLWVVTLSSLHVNSQKNLVDSNNDFAFKIYKATKTDTDNIFISPLSLNLALSIANEGALGSTKAEIDNLLSIEIPGDKAVLYKALISKTINLQDSAYYECIKETGDKSGGNALFLANSIWINNNSTIEKPYIKTIKDSYFSEVFDFENDKISDANQKLSNWVSEKTRNKIYVNNVLDPAIKLGIINAIYFKGEWDTEFKKKKTKEKIFHSLDGNRVKLDFMNNRTFYSYYEDASIQCVTLPYHCNQLSMFVILPKERFGINNFETNFSVEYFKEIQNNNINNEVILSLPKFKIESEIYPTSVISNLGFSTMFSSSADFTNISKIDSLTIGEIIHKTIIEIDEKKTEAAAVTEIVIVGYGGGTPAPLPPPKIFNANHPFIFMIVDNRTNAILFFGRFVNLK